MGLLRYLRGDDILSSNGNGESRALARENVPAAMLPYNRTASRRRTRCGSPTLTPVFGS